MELGFVIRFVLSRARVEAHTAKQPQMQPEHIFLGLLKAAEMFPSDFSPALTPDETEAIELDINALRESFDSRGINTKEARYLLRVEIRKGLKSPEYGYTVADILAEAARYADSEVIAAAAVLECLFKKASPFLINLFNLYESAQFDINEDELQPHVLRNKTKLRQLSDLMNKIAAMRDMLLNRVIGQDHIVRTFTEGIFNAELGLSENENSRPKSTFVFMGPPGVGKTFLAEQSAKALGVTFKRFDMSGYADRDAYHMLVGFEQTWKDSVPGILTTFVKSNPNCVLLFDEIEKAHISVIQLFLQILDAGILHDEYYAENISFSETYIIFTTNAGVSLYERDNAANAATMPKNSLLLALQTEKRPGTDDPFFPPAICSRLGIGYVLMFNKLDAKDLWHIASDKLASLCNTHEKVLGIKASADSLTSLALLLAEGGTVDARKITARTDTFFKSELQKLYRLWVPENFERNFSNLHLIRFELETENMSDGIKNYFEVSNETLILAFSDAEFASKLSAKLDVGTVIQVDDSDDLLKVIGEHNYNIAVVELTINGGATAAFDNAPFSATAFVRVRRILVALSERLPDLPVYILESEKTKISTELLAELSKFRVKGKLRKPKCNSDFDLFCAELNSALTSLHNHNVAVKLADSEQYLSFETAPIIRNGGKEAVIRLRNFSIHRAIKPEDVGSLVDDFEKPNVHFSDVIGAQEVKDELTSFIDYLHSPKKYLARGLQPPKGVLLYGPPGTGKTMLAKAFAGESSAAFFSVAGSGFVDRYVGSGPAEVRELFRKARRYAPSVVFIDEIDAIGRKRGASGASAHAEEMTLNALLVEMDGFQNSTKRPIFVLAATNFESDVADNSQVLDEALTRRFDRKILVDLPNEADRRLFLKLQLDSAPEVQVSHETIDVLATRSVGLSLSHLNKVVDLAKRLSARTNSTITDAMILEAFEQFRFGEVKDWGLEYLMRVARHEAGHAVLAYLSGKAPSYITIVGRHGQGGYVDLASEDGSPIMTKRELLDRIRVALGGRAAEILYYGAEEGLSTGVSSDLASATHIARRMICDYGMDSELGMAVLSHQDIQHGTLSSEVVKRISQLLDLCLDDAISTLESHKKYIDFLVSELQKKNKLTGSEINAAFDCVNAS